MIRELLKERYDQGFTIARYRVTTTQYALERRGLITFERNRNHGNLVRLQVTPSGVVAREEFKHLVEPVDPTSFTQAPTGPVAGFEVGPLVACDPTRKARRRPATRAQQARLKSIVTWTGPRSEYGGISAKSKLIPVRSLKPLSDKGLIKVWLNPDTLQIEYDITIAGALVADV